MTMASLTQAQFGRENQNGGSGSRVEILSPAGCRDRAPVWNVGEVSKVET